VLACIFSTRRYDADGVFELQKSSSDALDMESMMGGAAGGGGDSSSLNTDMQTQVDILKSDTLALRVIKDLNLEQNEDFKPHFSPLGWVFGLLAPRGGSSDAPSASLEDAPNRRQSALRTFAGHLTVKAKAGTRLIDVTFSNRDPKVAAAVVNHLIQGLIDFTFQTRFTATNQVSGWLESQLGDLRKDSEDLEKRVVALQQQSGLFGINATDTQGKPVIYSPELDRLQQASVILTQAETSRLIKESLYRVTASGNAELISQLSGTSLSGQSSQGVANALSLIQTLRSQEATLKAQIGQDESQFGKNYPKLVEERASLRSVEVSLQDEIGRIGMRAKNDYEVALQSEAGARKAYAKDRSEAQKQNDKTIEYAILSRESEQSQELYQDLLKRLKEAGIVEGLHSSNMTMVDIARVPARPSHPKVPILLAAGLFMGAFLGVGCAFLAEAVDNKVRGTEEIEQMHLPVIGIIPQMKQGKPVNRPTLLDASFSEFNEVIRSLRSTLMISRSGAPPRIILVTSGSPAEGKSTLSVNLAAAFAQSGKKVLLIESDMRRPVLRQRLQLKTTGGLSKVLTDPDATGQIEVLQDFPTLHVLPAGPPPPFPSELLGAAPLQKIISRWLEEFDLLIFDTPPVLPVTDTQLLMPYADASVLVARAESTSRIGLQRAYKLLLPHAQNPQYPNIGIVLNGISTRSAAYYGYYGNYGYTNYYSQEGGQNDKQNDKS
jgi:capsular exopolysaccharide synthesis family protein